MMQHSNRLLVFLSLLAFLHSLPSRIDSITPDSTGDTSVLYGPGPGGGPLHPSWEGMAAFFYRMRSRENWVPRHRHATSPGPKDWALRPLPVPWPGGPAVP
jgi:hypothetical protein